ncbi:MAG: alpha/beta hydrolase [Lachnospirales bacterium]
MINVWNGTPLGYNKDFDNEHNKGLPLLEEFPIYDKKKHSAILIFPGGGYDHLSDHEGANVAKELNKKGISAFVFYYRVAPYTHPTYIFDAKRAIRYIRYNAEKYNIDPNKIGVMGFSAGGHLASVLALHYDHYEYDKIDDIDDVLAKPDSLCLCYPVISITKDIKHQRTSDNISGKDENIKKALSSELCARGDMPPTFMWHTFEDMSVDCRNSLEMAMAMKEKNASFELHIFPKGKHGLDLAIDVEGTDQWFSLYLNWLKRIGFTN